MNKYRFLCKSLLLVISTCIVALSITSSRIWSQCWAPQCIDISDVRKIHKYCPTAEWVIDFWYKNAAPDSPFYGYIPELPFGTIPKIGNCLDITGNNWCGCIGADCFSPSTNDRLSVQLLQSKSASTSKWWRIKFINPIDNSDIHRDNSSCFQDINDPTGTVINWVNDNVDINYITSGTMVDNIVFKIPLLGLVSPDGEICMWEFKIGQAIYHEHFVTNDSCYAWIDLKVTPPPPSQDGKDGKRVAPPDVVRPVVNPPGGSGPPAQKWFPMPRSKPNLN